MLLSETHTLFSPPQVKTFEAINIETREHVILKAVQSENPDLLIALQEAVLALRQVHLLKIHPGIMQLTEEEGYFTWRVLPCEPESHFMATQKVKGIPLDVWISRHGPVDEGTACRWLKQLTKSADALHREGFVHQDIKPANIVRREPDGQLVLVDLGAIRYLDASQSMHPEIQKGFKSYSVIGTPGYQSPEQTEGRPGPASDYYSIGLTLIHALTGIHPLDLPASDAGGLLWRDRAHISTPLADLIDQLAEPNQIRRPSSAQNILDYLDSLPEARRLAKKNRWPWLRSRTAKITIFFLLALGASLAIGTRSAWSSLQNRSDANQLFSQGLQMISTGMPGQAIPALEQAAELVPDNVDIRATLALAYALSGDVDRAVGNYNLALDLSPGNPFIHYNLASVYEEIDPQRAIAQYKIAARSDSDIRDAAINNLARVYILTKDLDEAENLLEADAQTDLVQAVVNKNRGWLRFEQGDFEKSLRYLEKSIELDPTRPDAYCLMALIKRQQGRADESDEITCLSLPTPDDRPEVQRWKAQLLRLSQLP